ncbi:hypothetical protein C7S13_0575 [Burkholderia cepacia]|nr:hypothetical protein [Burkholderia cepacia]
MLIALAASMQPHSTQSDATTVLAHTRRLKRYFIGHSL